ncbi:hypothetical protein T4B_2097 [Trichinella pseudospiralis]|uniref:Uncharacterized protein n=1 Tax=Trichinella pseudospiralis TaxID=6337 RepID=A0A0V1K873_TRIPS|nr:hypothetical protein T4A_10822 [Trichinella pseudospiralis]KRZ31076.1 hypothetical protein T4B_2097 [Trichinella pseudospiralis]KRZ43411.1 hypothetical protein T4C_5711 [Trichinella pseudospiralis]
MLELERERKILSGMSGLIRRHSHALTVGMRSSYQDKTSIRNVSEKKCFVDYNTLFHILAS